MGMAATRSAYAASKPVVWPPDRTMRLCGSTSVGALKTDAAMREFGGGSVVASFAHPG